MNLGYKLSMPLSVASIEVTPRSNAVNFTRASALNLIGEGVPIVVGIVVLRLLIPRLQEDRFTVLSLAWTAITYFSVFDLGLSRALTQSVARRIGGGGSGAAVEGIISTGLAMMLLLGVCGGLTMALLTPALIAWLHVPASLIGESRGVFYMLAMSIPLVLLTAGLRGVLEAFGRFGSLAAVRIVTGTLVFLAPLTIVFFTRNLVAVVGGVVGVRLLGTVLHGCLCARVVRKGKFEKNHAWELFRFGGWITASSVAIPAMVYLDRVVVARTVYFAAAAFYGTPSDLVIRMLFVPAAVGSVLFPALSAQIGGASAVTLDRGGRLICTLLFPLALLLAGLGPEAIHLWLGPVWAEHSGRVMQISAIALFIGGMSFGPVAAIHAAGRPDLTAVFHMMELPLHIGALLLLTRLWGIEGAAAAFVLRVIIDYAAVVVAARRLLPEAAIVLKTHVTATLLGAMIVAGVGCVTSLRVRLILLAICLPGFAIVAFSRWLHPEDVRWFMRATGARQRPLP